jgi:hypothetical protein
MDGLLQIDRCQSATRRVPFDFPPKALPGRLQTLFRDPDGNGLILAER